MKNFYVLLFLTLSLFLKKRIEISIFQYSKRGYTYSPLLLNTIKDIYSKYKRILEKILRILVHETSPLKKKNKKAIEGFRFRDGMGFRLYGPAVSVPAIKTGAWRSIDLLLFYLIFSLSSRFKFSSVANFQFFIRKKN